MPICGTRPSTLALSRSGLGSRATGIEQLDDAVRVTVEMAVGVAADEDDVRALAEDFLSQVPRAQTAAQGTARAEAVPASA
jgi:hypothetical protein